MTVIAIIVAALVSAAAWGDYLAHRYGQQVSPDGTLPQGFFTLAGWFLIAAVATVLVVVL